MLLHPPPRSGRPSRPGGRRDRPCARPRPLRAVTPGEHTAGDPRHRPPAVPRRVRPDAPRPGAPASFFRAGTGAAHPTFAYPAPSDCAAAAASLPPRPVGGGPVGRSPPAVQATAPRLLRRRGTAAPAPCRRARCRRAKCAAGREGGHAVPAGTRTSPTPRAAARRARTTPLYYNFHHILSPIFRPFLLLLFFR